MKKHINSDVSRLQKQYGQKINYMEMFKIGPFHFLVPRQRSNGWLINVRWLQILYDTVVIVASGIPDVDPLAVCTL